MNPRSARLLQAILFMILAPRIVYAETVPKSVCQSGQTFSADKARKHHLKVFELKPANEAIVIRYLNATQGTPPDFTNFPNHKAYYAGENSGQLCDDYGCSPAPTGFITFTDGACVIYQINGTVAQLNKIVAGQWSLDTH